MKTTTMGCFRTDRKDWKEGESRSIEYNQEANGEDKTSHRLKDHREWTMEFQVRAITFLLNKSTLNIEIVATKLRTPSNTIVNQCARAIGLRYKKSLLQLKYTPSSEMSIRKIKSMRE